MLGLEITIEQILLLEALVFAACFAAGIVAFGWAMIMGPVLLLLLEPRVVVDVNLALGTVLIAVLVATVWRHISWHTVAPMTAGAWVGIPLGTWALTSVTDTTLRVGITALVLILLIPALLGRLRPLPYEALAAGGVGLAVGTMLAGTALGGPLAAFFAVNQGWSRDRTRANLAGFFITVTPLIMAAHAVTGVFTSQTLVLVLVLVPAALLGSYVATRVVRHIDERLFRRLVLATIVGTSLAVLVREAVRMV